MNMNDLEQQRINHQSRIKKRAAENQAAERQRAAARNGIEMYHEQRIFNERHGDL